MSTEFFILAAIAILLSLTVHEYAHAKIADAAGDPTPRIYGRVTLNPMAHLDPMGTLMILFTIYSGFGIGWGRPVLVDPRKMRDPRWDWFASVAAGPMSNLLLAGIGGALFRVVGGYDGSVLGAFLYLFVTVNIGLALFNLIPFGPLDGHWLAGLLMPERLRDRWFWWNRRYGFLILLAVILGGQFARNGGYPQFDLVGSVLRPGVERMERMLLGPPPRIISAAEIEEPVPADTPESQTR